MPRPHDEPWLSKRKQHPLDQYRWKIIRQRISIADLHRKIGKDAIRYDRLRNLSVGLLYTKPADWKIILQSLGWTMEYLDEHAEQLRQKDSPSSTRPLSDLPETTGKGHSLPANQLLVASILRTAYAQRSLKALGFKGILFLGDPCLLDECPSARRLGDLAGVPVWIVASEFDQTVQLWLKLEELYTFAQEIS